MSGAIGCRRGTSGAVGGRRGPSGAVGEKNRLVGIRLYSAIWGLLDKDNDLKASHQLMNTERIWYTFQLSAEI